MSSQVFDQRMSPTTHDSQDTIESSFAVRPQTILPAASRALSESWYCRSHTADRVHFCPLQMLSSSPICQVHGISSRQCRCCAFHCVRRCYRPRQLCRAVGSCRLPCSDPPHTASPERSVPVRIQVAAYLVAHSKSSAESAFPGTGTAHNCWSIC